MVHLIKKFFCISRSNIIITLFPMHFCTSKLVPNFLHCIVFHHSFQLCISARNIVELLLFIFHTYLSPEIQPLPDIYRASRSGTAPWRQSSVVRAHTHTHNLCLSPPLLLSVCLSVFRPACLYAQDHRTLPVGDAETGNATKYCYWTHPAPTGGAWSGAPLAAAINSTAKKA